VITNDVPADALGIARARQRNVDEYARRRRQLQNGDEDE
jgi:bifunctional N-acetylglucosamine-1-phosphate-uridyltransferase/glucosamine-1-phosphate-acetyltransferase GlmU-like protein